MDEQADFDLQDDIEDAEFALQRTKSHARWVQLAGFVLVPLLIWWRYEDLTEGEVLVILFVSVSTLLIYTAVLAVLAQVQATELRSLNRRKRSRQYNT